MKNKKRLFLHLPKNGGMTIRHSSMLKDKVIIATKDTHKKGYSKQVAKKMQETGDHHGYEHARWRDIDEKITNNYQAFCIIRNPWDRVVSRYFFAKKVIEVEKKQKPSYADVSSFETFLEERFKWGNQFYMWHRAVRNWYPALEHIIDDNGNVRADCLRFEYYNRDICDYFKIEEMSRARNVTGLNKQTYKEMYTPKTIQIIADWYKDDIEYFGFDFNTSATKNYWKEQE